jgi:ribosome recycling factor
MYMDFEGGCCVVEYEVISQAKEKMTKTVSVLSRDLATLRAGRATPQALDRIMVDYYGTPTPINQVGNISAPEPRLLVIAPWDPSMITAIEKAIQKSDLGINPANDGKLIRLIFPELTQERRRELVKIVKKKGEEAKIATRSIRREANERLKKQKKESIITEDDLKDFENLVQEATDESIREIDRIVADKEKEIMEV